jgi:hypothetical protein
LISLLLPLYLILYYCSNGGCRMKITECDGHDDDDVAGDGAAIETNYLLLIMDVIFTA